MKLATLRDGTRDGRLLVVSGSLREAVLAPYTTLQAALDDWEEAEPQLQMAADALATGRMDDAFPFDPAACESPLPRAYQWADGSAYVNHVELVRRARGAELPESFWSDPLMYQGGSDSFLGPRDAIEIFDRGWGADFEAEIAVVTDDVPMGASTELAAERIRLIMLVNDVSLRNLIPGELAKGFGFFQSKPSSAFSPVAVTPDELGGAWDGRKLYGVMSTDLNGEAFGRPETGEDMTFDFPQLVAHAARTRNLTAGTIIGSGTISNRGDDGGPGKPGSDGGRGYSCIAERRMLDKIETGEFRTPFLEDGDTVRIEMLDDDGDSIFGAIEQTVAEIERR
ncbi:fumarylacetoacetate hydrolase family protein [uncultured Abyssibacter sp.]|uniref:fumarylacetoacetate hydrolase family protein n=1 Tax=uncultured Abyssibacter sp. TaxID=2320202 RepID=UPI0032B1CF4D